jgi:23S rRNA (cytosine1962-C5)-methyltransferase
MMTVLIETVVQKLNGLIPNDTNTWDSQRLFHGRGRCFSGFEQISVDLYSPVILLTVFKPLDKGFEQSIIESLKTVVRQFELGALQVQRRYLNGSPSETLMGALPEETYAYRNKLKYSINFNDRQNIGFFLDMEQGRQWLEERAKDKNILNLFSYTCAFSVVASAAGAKQVVNVDMSKSALSQGRINHQLNNQTTRNIKFLPEDILKSWSRVCRPGPYDIAIIDPPSYQPGSFVADKDYVKLLRRIPQFMAPGGELLLCLNSPEKDCDFIQELISESCPECEFIQRLPTHSDFPDQNANSALKLLSYRYN